KQATQADPQTATILVNLYDGTRELLPAKTEVLLRVIDGDQRHVFEDFVKVPSIRITVPFQNGMRDTYTVLASADGYSQAGFHHVQVSPKLVRPVFLMLLPKEFRWDFSQSQWDVLQQKDPALSNLFRQGAASESQAQERYEQIMEDSPESIACLFNILTAM